ncbi:hypothetical protein PsorP6_015178 [Peronosclerospora sorghi]|uniref:Uncharacterized protein n=1 Tax=Peronosclerospora sorghi TaxID=230839 RepID=A0ACC0VRF0_9STRA|nr:hypothetical protein PsorP6_015178 [Peronosclerospora sorghi]
MTAALAENPMLKALEAFLPIGVDMCVNDLQLRYLPKATYFLAKVKFSNEGLPKYWGGKNLKE